MAKKPQRLSQSLGRLRALEQDTAVVASPVDTFTRQAAVTESTRAREIERGLSQLSPVIAGYFKAKGEQQREEELKEGITRYRNATPEEREADIKLIENGDPRQSEFWMEGYARSYLEDKADDMATNFGIAFAEQSENPNFDYDQFADEYVRNYTLQNGLDAFDDDLLIDNYYGRIDGIIAQRRQNFNEQQIAKVTEEREALYENDISRAFNGAISEEGGVNFDMLSGSINALVEHRIATGGKASTIIDSTVNGLTAIGANMADNGLSDWETVLDVMANIKNRFGTYGETTTGRLNIERLRQQFQTAEDAADDDALKQQKEDDEIEARAIKEALISAISNDPSLSGDVQAQTSNKIVEVEGFGSMTIKDAMARLAITDFTTFRNMRTFGNDYASRSIKSDVSVVRSIENQLKRGLPEDEGRALIEENASVISATDYNRLVEMSTNSSVLKRLFDQTAATDPFDQIKNARKVPYGSGFEEGAVEAAELGYSKYIQMFDAWQSEGNDISTTEGRAKFFEWHQRTVKELVDAAKIKQDVEIPAFWKTMERGDLYTQFYNMRRALKDGTDITSLDLYDNVIGYIDQHNAQNPENKIMVRDVVEFIRRDIEQ